MKKFISFFAFAAAVAVSMMSATSCEEFLNKAPSSDQSKEYIFQDYLRSQRYLDVLYYNMLPTWLYSGKFQGYYGMLESATDMSEYTADYGATNKSFNVGNWKHASAKYEVSTVWYDCYEEIRRANMFMENMKNFANEPEGRKPMMEGECHWMLAYYYFELYRRYGGVPLVKKVLTLEDNYKLARSTDEETMNYILSELDTAENLVPDVWPDEDRGRVTKAWCKALRSRATLYAASPSHNPDNDMEKWKRAALASKDCLDYCESTGYHQLYHDYQNIFMRYTPDKISEIIVYKIAGSLKQSFNNQLIYYEQASPGEDYWGGASNSPTQNLVDLYPVITYDAAGNATGTVEYDKNNPEMEKAMYENRDPRFYYTILFNGRFWYKRDIQTWRDGTNFGLDRNPKDQLYSRTGYYLRKFWPRECKDTNMPGSASFCQLYIRLAEIYLNYAEAVNEILGPDTPFEGGMTAIEAANKIRERLVCPADADIKNSKSDPYYYVRVEREENPLFPVLPNGLPGIKKGLSKDDARRVIRNERTIEFAFEDQYFYDVLRWKQGKEHIATTIYGCDVVKSGDNFTYNRVVVEDRSNSFDENRMYLYPIPEDEVYILGVDQNPGW